MKKILSLVLVAAMLASMLVFVPAAGATEVPTVAAGSVMGAPGETVMVPVTITADEFTSFSALVEYDGERLAFAEVDFAPIEELADGYKVATNADAVYNNWYDNGSFVSFSWTAAEGAAEAAEGEVVVNIIFTVKETAPLGAAYVALRDYGAANAAGNAIYGTLVETPDALYQGAGNIACENGVVVVLHEEWMDTTASNEDDFDISDGELGAYGYIGSDDVVVIPSTVTSIATAAFLDSTVKTVIIPASVETIAAGAFLNCAALTDVYILGGDTVLVEGCIGWSGTYVKKTKKLTIKDFYYGDEDCLTSLTTIHAVANDNVATYAENGDGFLVDYDPESITPFTYDLLDGYTVSFGGCAVFAPANTKAPGQMVIDGETVVAWQNGDAVVAPGADITFTADTTLAPITIKAPVTSTVAGIKANADVQKAGLRFTATLDIADYEALAALGTVELGMLVTPAAYVAKAGAFTKTALDAIKVNNATYVDIALGGYFEKTETEYTFAAQLTNFSASTYAKNPNFVAVMYATVTINGVATTVYGAYNWEGMQNVKAVATAAQTAAGATDTVKAQLAALVAKFN